MKITEIIVNAGRTIPHPMESYSNLRPNVTLKATLEDGDDVDSAVRNLQAKCEGMVDDHAKHLSESIVEKYHADRRERELLNLEAEIRMKQSQLEHLRDTSPKELTALAGSERVTAEYVND